jgi:hypothetical protein
MKAPHANFGIAAVIVPMFAALIVPTADSSPEHIDFRGWTMLEETAFFYDDIDADSENSRAAWCEHGTPAGGLGDWSDDVAVPRNIQSAERTEIPPDALQMFVEECDDPAESGDIVTPSNRTHLSSQRRFKTFAARFRRHEDTS